MDTLSIMDYGNSVVFPLVSTTLSAILVDTPDFAKQFVKDMANHPEFQGEWLGFFRVSHTHHIRSRCVAFCYPEYEI